jgi:5-methylcytosine-specific restriction endonuclease McrA
MKRSIKEPIPEILEAWGVLTEAVEAHLGGDSPRAEVYFKKADLRAVWEWLNPAWVRPDLNVVFRSPPGDTRQLLKGMRDPDRDIVPATRAAVLQRDGYRCRYCGIPVVHADIRKLAHHLYPDAVPWDQFDPAKQHSAFACLWLQFDHVVPHSHGGRSSVDNVVVSCALCNYGKDKYTLRQLDLTDPRLTPPVACGWDGLERFRAGEPLRVARRVRGEKA